VELPFHIGHSVSRLGDSLSWHICNLASHRLISQLSYFSIVNSNPSLRPHIAVRGTSLVVDALEVIGKFGNNHIGISSLNRCVVLCVSSSFAFYISSTGSSSDRHGHTSQTRMACWVGTINTPRSPLRPITSSASARTAMNLNPWRVIPLAAVEYRGSSGTRCKIRDPNEWRYRAERVTRHEM
jgi:hypothetical protein